MHDPLTVAFEIYYPWHWKIFRPSRSRLCKNHKYFEPFITIWHKDPCKDRTDDSCGCFMRSRHGNKEVLEKIVKEFDFNWDSKFESESGHIYYTGYFKPDSTMNMTIHGIVLDLFFRAAYIVFGYNRRKTDKYLNKDLARILHFAENPIDSLNRSISRVFENGCNEEYSEKVREEWIRNTARCVYGYILRDIRPWYKHPRWHIWHWRLQIHPWQNFKRRYTDKCYFCGKKFKGETPCSDWDGTKIFHSACDDSKKDNL